MLPLTRGQRFGPEAPSAHSAGPPSRTAVDRRSPKTSLRRPRPRVVVESLTDGQRVQGGRSPRAPRSQKRSSVVDGAAGDAFLIQATGQVEALEQELDGGRDDGGLLGPVGDV